MRLDALVSSISSLAAKSKEVFDAHACLVWRGISSLLINDNQALQRDFSMTATSRILALEYALLPITPWSEELDKTFQLAAQLNNHLKLG